MGLDVAGVRRLFPALDEGIACFDGPGGTQVPTPVAEAVARASGSSAGWSTACAPWTA